MLNFIPMPHKIILTSASGELDEWGLPVSGGAEKTIKARIQYNTSREKIAVSSGDEIVYTADILLDGLPAVSYTDKVRFVDELGNVVEKSPLKIEYKADFSGKPVLVKVVV